MSRRKVREKTNEYEYFPRLEGGQMENCFLKGFFVIADSSHFFNLPVSTSCFHLSDTNSHISMFMLFIVLSHPSLENSLRL